MTRTNKQIRTYEAKAIAGAVVRFKAPCRTYKFIPKFDLWHGTQFFKTDDENMHIEEILWFCMFPCQITTYKISEITENKSDMWPSFRLFTKIIKLKEKKKEKTKRYSLSSQTRVVNFALSKGSFIKEKRDKIVSKLGTWTRACHTLNAIQQIWREGNPLLCNLN